MMRDAALGMVYLHTSRPAIVHHDLTPGNLLVDKTWRVKARVHGLPVPASRVRLPRAFTFMSRFLIE